jgi:hypothetical protein
MTQATPSLHYEAIIKWFFMALVKSNYILFFWEQNRKALPSILGAKL